MVANRALGLHAGALGMSDRVPGITPDILDKALNDYEVSAFCDRGWAIGALAIKGPEIHVAIIPSYRRRWLTMTLIKKVLGSIVGKHGFAITQVMADNEIGHLFVQRLGFDFERRDGETTYYRMVAQ